MIFPVHFHKDFEITLVIGADGRRIVGNEIKHFTDMDLTLIFPDTLHGYKWDPGFSGADVFVIQFSNDIKDFPVFSKDILSAIGKMLSSQNMGISYSQQTAQVVKDKIIALPKSEGIEGIVLFFEILYNLAISENMDYISTIPIKPEFKSYLEDRERINRIILFIEKNYMNKISLNDISATVCMSPSALSRYFKKKTGYNIWEYLNNYRIGVAAHKIVKTDECIYNICYSSGFNNVSNFNREFKKRFGVSPGEYKKMLATIK